MSNNDHDTNGQASASALPWKNVDDATLPEPTHEKNHYDDPHVGVNYKELEAVPGEHVAMFYGLQVLQGHEYTVKNGELRVVVHGEGTSVVDDAANKTNQQQQEKSSKDDIQKRNGKKRKANSKDTMDTGTSSYTLDIDKQVEAAATESISDSQERSESKTKKKKKKKQKKESTKESPDELQPDKDVVERMQTSWMIATGGATLDPQICCSLVKQNFWMPTLIQSATLPAAMMGRRNIVGAAPTGSGKTLAYLLPIVQYLLQEQQEQQQEAAAAAAATAARPSRYLLALILTPTRELAIQVSRECDKLVPKQCGTIVGGLALQKQERILTKNRPPILVATPGRLWELVRFERKHTTRCDFLLIRLHDDINLRVHFGVSMAMKITYILHVSPRVF
jgi:ATP-dependent RNA helicase DDX24/MAK5